MFAGSDALVAEEGQETDAPGQSPWSGFRISCLAPQSAPKAQGKAKAKSKQGSKRKGKDKDKENAAAEGADGSNKRACNWINLNPNVVPVDKSTAPVQQNGQLEDTQMTQIVMADSSTENGADRTPESISTADQQWLDDMTNDLRSLLEINLPKGEDTKQLKEITDAKQKGITAKLQLVSRMHSAIVVSCQSYHHVISSQGNT